MALQGTIDTFDLTEVIRMLALGEKTGRLGMSGDRGSGSLWFVDGEVVASDTDISELVADHAAVLFQLLRFREGSFVFDQGSRSADEGAGAEAEPIVEEAVRRLDEWSEIEQVVPSLEHRVDLRRELPRSDVVLDQSGWRAVAAIGGGITVGELGRRLDQDELDVSRTVKALVELGLVEVAEPVPVAELASPPVTEPLTTAPAQLGDLGHESSEPEMEPASDGHPENPWNGSGEGGSTMDGPDLDAGLFDEAEPEAGPSPEPVDEGSRSQLDALASGFGLTDEPFGAEPTAFEASVPADPMSALDESLEFGEPEPLPGAVDEGAGSFPIEEAEAAGEARTPLFAHDAEQSSTVVDDLSAMAQPGEAAEVARQLANLSPEAARAVAAAARATTDEEREAALALVAEDGDEPLDPDLLRSFLSSVRQ